jgi:hypothetical protein
MSEWIAMVKDGEEKMVHPANVDNHKRAGWNPVAPESAPEPKAEMDTMPMIDVEPEPEPEPEITAEWESESKPEPETEPDPEPELEPETELKVDVEPEGMAPKKPAKQRTASKKKTSK